MPLTIITTCGTSVLAAGCWKGLTTSYLGCGRDEQKKIQGDNEEKVRAFRSENLSPDLLAATFDHGIPLATAFGTGKPAGPVLVDRLRDLPAEIATLAALAYDLGKHGIARDDRLFLLHANNDEGDYCVCVLKKVLEDKASLKVVRLEPIEHLDPDGGMFSAGILQLRERCRAIVKERPEDSLYFNLTGGYKAMGIALGALCHEMVEKEKRDVHAVYLHETATYRNLSHIQIGSGANQQGTDRDIGGLPIPGPTR